MRALRLIVLFVLLGVVVGSQPPICPRPESDDDNSTFISIMANFWDSDDIPENVLHDAMSQMLAEVANSVGLYDVLPKTMTYHEAMTHCESRRGRRLCMSSDYCPHGRGSMPHPGILTGPGKRPEDHWAPVSNRLNDWVYIGTDPNKMCMSYYDLNTDTPTWGLDSSVEVSKNRVYCCPMVMSQIDFPLTWQDAVSYCKTRNKRLCSHSDYCPQGERHSPVGGVTLRSEWAPVQDEYNEWVLVTARASNDLVCRLHSDLAGGPPNWGTRRNAEPKRSLIMCCDEHFMNLKGKIKHTEAVNLCRMQGKRLCNINEYCPSGPGNAPYGGVRTGLAWSPVGDGPNKWIQVGGQKQKLCTTYESQMGQDPDWGETDGWLGFVQCCATQRVGLDAKQGVLGP